MYTLSMKTANCTHGTSIDAELAFSCLQSLYFSFAQFCKFHISLVDILRRILCWLQTGNLLKGETTCERFAKTNYKVLHQYHKE